MDKTLQYYLAGPMTGLPQFNVPLFEQVAKWIREQGFKLTSPVELDSQKVRDAALASPDGKLEDDKIAGETWGEILARDVHVIADQIDAIITLPNWDRSRGARLEVFVALLQGKPIFCIVWNGAVSDAAIVQIPTKEVAAAIYRSFTQ